MLKYLIEVTQALFIPAVLLGMLLGFQNRFDGKKKGKWIVVIGILTGLAAGIVMAVLKNTTKLIDTGLWNLRIFAFFLSALLVFLVFFWKRLQKATKPVGETVFQVACAGLAGSSVFYAAPDVYLAPFKFPVSEDTSVFSTDYILPLVGYLAGILLAVVTMIAVNRISRKMDTRFGRIGFDVILFLTLGIIAFQYVLSSFSVLLAKRYVTSNKFMFNLAKFGSNNSDLFIYGVLILAAALAVLLWVQSFLAKDHPKNNAQHRKFRAYWRNLRRWAVTIGACCLASVLTLTVAQAIENQEVVLSPIEECEQREDGMYVPLTQVQDGHLHRFAYTTESGTQIRFIVIKKPNSEAYGIGLDACDICGETGYFERDGQVVCKLCDVVMNINTIGFKGGCNPLVIDYSIEDGYIIVPFYTLLEYEKEFR